MHKKESDFTYQVGSPNFVTSPAYIIMLTAASLFLAIEIALWLKTGRVGDCIIAHYYAGIFTRYFHMTSIHKYIWTLTNLKIDYR